jgi:hypothetical protein
MTNRVATSSGFIVGAALVCVTLLSASTIAQRGGGTPDPALAALIADDPPFVLQRLSLTDVPAGTAKRALFDGRTLANWDRWLGVVDATKMMLGTEPIIGLNNEEYHVYAVVTEDGAPAIRIGGEPHGALVSKEEFGNYHLHLDYKWGPRPAGTNTRYNSGIFFHSHGAYGGMFGQFMPGIEFAIWENATGNTTLVGSSEGAHSYAETNRHIGASSTIGHDPSLNGAARRFMAGGRMVELSGMLPPHSYPEKIAEWNSLDLYAYDDGAIYVIDNVPVSQLFQITTIRTKGGPKEPLTRGRLQLESEGSVIFYRNITIDTIDRLPKIAVN